MKTIALTLTIAALLGLGNSQVAQGQSALRQFSMGKQAPDSAPLGGMASYLVTVTRAGSGSLDVYLTTRELPAGCAVSFVPPKVSFTDQGPSTKTATMVIAVPKSLKPGLYDFTVAAQHGNSRNVLSSPNTLSVGSTTIVIQQPVLNIPVLQTNGTIGLSGSGTPSQPILVQATTNLAAPVWETIAVPTLDDRGLFGLVDQDSTNFPARFYRLAQ
jgi:hypothetical protein